MKCWSNITTFCCLILVIRCRRWLCSSGLTRASCAVSKSLCKIPSSVSASLTIWDAEGIGLLNTFCISSRARKACSSPETSVSWKKKVKTVKKRKFSHAFWQPHLNLSLPRMTYRFYSLMPDDFTC